MTFIPDNRKIYCFIPCDELKVKSGQCSCNNRIIVSMENPLKEIITTEDNHLNNLMATDELDIFLQYRNSPVICEGSNLEYNLIGFAGDMLMLQVPGTKGFENFISPLPKFCKLILRNPKDMSVEERADLLTLLGYGIKSGYILHIEKYEFSIDTGDDHYYKPLFWLPRNAADYLRRKGYCIDPGLVEKGKVIIR